MNAAHLIELARLGRFGEKARCAPEQAVYQALSDAAERLSSRDTIISETAFNCASAFLMASALVMLGKGQMERTMVLTLCTAAAYRFGKAFSEQSVLCHRAFVLEQQFLDNPLCAHEDAPHLSAALEDNARMILSNQKLPPLFPRLARGRQAMRRMMRLEP